MSTSRDQDIMRAITTSTAHLKKLHNESVRLSASLMSMAGADPEPIGDSVVFWTFANTGEHATIDAAISRIGAHPAVQKLVSEYHEVTSQMVDTERYISRLTASLA